jgi:hypothetical protein
MKLAQPRLPILLLSGVADAPAGTENTDKFLSKSEGPEKLLAVVAELLRYRRLHVLVGAFSAEIVCDTLKTPDLWHYVVPSKSFAGARNRANRQPSLPPHGR